MSSNPQAHSGSNPRPSNFLSSLETSPLHSGWAKSVAARIHRANELSLAGRLLEQGRVDAALAELHRIRQTALKSSDWLLAEIVSQHLANAFRQLGDPTTAAIWQQQSIAHRVRSSPESARSTDSDLARLACELTGLGGDAFRREDFDLAETYWGRALAIEEWRGDWEGQALDIGNLGLLAAARGDFEQGIRRLKRSFRLHCLMFDELHAGIDLVNLAELFRLRGEFSISLRALNNASRRFERAEAPPRWTELAASRRREVERIVQLQTLDPRRN